MEKRTLTPEDPIFKDEDVLRDHFPDRILERNEKIREYLNMFKEVIRNKRPRNVFVHGPTGVGKTIGTKAVLDRLHLSIDQYDYESSAEFDEPSLKTVHLECRDMNTSYQVAAHLINKFRKDTERGEIRTTGYPEGEIYAKLFNELNTIEESHVIIAFDEIDNIGDDDKILYKLPRCNNDNANATVDPEVTKVGVIGITNDSTFKEHLDPRAKSSLCDQDIYFPPYDAKELRTILKDRASDAFHDDILTDEVIPLVAAFAAQRSGYARTALDLLYESGTVANKNSASRVTEEHVRVAEDSIQQDAIVNDVSNLSTQGKLIAYTLFRMDEEHELPAKQDKIQAWYETFATQIDMDVVSGRTISRTLNDLVVAGAAMSHEVNKGRKGGRSYEYDLDVKRDIMLEGLEGDTRLQDVEGDGDQGRL
jgi:cell division control protein 6